MCQIFTPKSSQTKKDLRSLFLYSGIIRKHACFWNLKNQTLFQWSKEILRNSILKMSCQIYRQITDKKQKKSSLISCKATEMDSFNNDLLQIVIMLRSRFTRFTLFHLSLTRKVNLKFRAINKSWSILKVKTRLLINRSVMYYLS